MTTKPINIRATKKARYALKLLATLRGKSMQETAEDIFEAELEKEQQASGGKLLTQEREGDEV